MLLERLSHAFGPSGCEEEVRNIIQRAHDAAKKILTENKTKLKEIAEQLMLHETLEEEELNKLFEGLTPQPASS